MVRNKDFAEQNILSLVAITSSVVLVVDTLSGNIVNGSGNRAAPSTTDNTDLHVVISQT